MNRFERPSAPESGPARPSEEEIGRKYRNIVGMREEDPAAFESNRSEIRGHARGDGDAEDRSLFYPGWTPEDFLKLDGMLADPDAS